MRRRIRQIGQSFMAGLVLAGTVAAAVQGVPLAEPPAPASADPQGAAPPATEAPQPHTDRYGDPLPHGVVARLGTLFFRQPWVGCLAYSPDAKLLASGGSDGRVQLWDPETGKERGHLARRPGHVQAIAFSPDGTLLASAGNDLWKRSDYAVRIWDVAARKELRVLAGHTHFVTTLAFSPDGRLLASAGFDKTLRIWDVPTGRELRCFAPPDPVSDSGVLAFSPDGKTLAVAGYGRFHLLDVAGWTAREPLKGDIDGTEGLAFTPDGRSIVTCSADKTVRLWDVAARKQKWRRDEAEYVLGLALSADGKMVATGDLKGTLVVRETAGGRELARWRAATDVVRVLAFSPDGKALASVAPCSDIRLWDPTTGKRLNPSAEAVGTIERLAFSPDGRRLAAVAEERLNGSIRLWDTKSWQELGRIDDPKERVGGIAFSPDGKILATGHGKPAVVRLWDSLNGKPRGEVPCAGTYLGAISFGPAGDRLAYLVDQYLIVSELGTGRERLKIAGLQGSYWGPSYSPDGRLLACVRGGTQLLLWDAATGEKVCEQGRHGSGGTLLVFSPDGRTVALASGGEKRENTDKVNTEVCLRETATGAECCRLAGHEGNVGAAAFSPDGRLLASSSLEEETVRIWDAATGTELCRLTGHRGSVRSLAFSPDGKQLASGGDDSTVLIWDVPALVPARKPPAADLTDGQLKDLRATLASADGAKVYQAIAALAHHPGQAGPFLRDALKHFPVADGRRMDRLIADLDDEDFATREKASMQLADEGRLAEAALKRALYGHPSAEVERRVRALLDKLRDKAPPPDRLRGLRAAEALERIGTEPAREALKALAEGSADSALSLDAKASLERLAKRPRAMP
jgi:WD40 repeat protein